MGNKNPDILNAKESKFCEAYVNKTNFNAIDAVSAAGYSTNTHSASNLSRLLLNTPRIQRRIADLVGDRDRTSQVDRFWVREKLKKIVEENDKTNYNAQLKALELIGKDLGMFSGETSMEEVNDAGDIAKLAFEKRKREGFTILKKEGDDNGSNEDTTGKSDGNRVANVSV